MPSPKAIWYAAYTRSRAEKKVAQELGYLGIEHYLPLVTTIRQWSDRKKKIQVPLIRSYIFVRITKKQFMPVFQVMGVIRIVHFDGMPVPIPDWQIENLKIIMGARVAVQSERISLEKGQEVCITMGAMRGLRGTIIHIKGRRKLAISITALDYNLTIDIDSSLVEQWKGGNEKVKQ